MIKKIYIVFVQNEPLFVSVVLKL